MVVFGYLGIAIFVCVLLFYKNDYEKGMKCFKQRNYSEAVKYFKDSDKIGDEDGSFMLGKCFEFGYGVPKDYKQAIIYYEKSGNKGKTEGLLAAGILHARKKDYSAAVRFLTKASQKNYGPAEVLLAIFFYEGRGVKQDYSEAVRLLQKSIENTSTPAEFLKIAQWLLGECYYYGRGVKQDYADAVNLYRRSADNGFPDAFCALGRCHEKGHGVKRDSEGAFKHYKKAAENGNAEAQCQVGNYYRRRGNEMPSNYQLAVEYYQKAADQEYVEGLKRLAWCYRHGRGVKKDIVKAETLENKAELIVVSKQ